MRDTYTETIPLLDYQGTTGSETVAVEVREV